MPQLQKVGVSKQRNPVNAIGRSMKQTNKGTGIYLSITQTATRGKNNLLTGIGRENKEARYLQKGEMIDKKSVGRGGSSFWAFAFKNDLAKANNYAAGPSIGFPNRRYTFFDGR